MQYLHHTSIILPCISIYSTHLSSYHVSVFAPHICHLTMYQYLLHTSVILPCISICTTHLSSYHVSESYELPLVISFMQKLQWPSSRNQLLQMLIKKQWDRKAFNDFCDVLKDTQKDEKFIETFGKKAHDFMKGT